VSKKLIIITAAAGLISFAGAFVIGWLTKPVIRSGEPNQPTLAGQGTDAKPALPGAGITSSSIGASDSSVKRAMTEKQLENLAIEVREKMQEYNNKLQGIKMQEQRLQIAEEVLKKDIENLNNLRVELATMTASLNEERDKLLKSRLEIAQAEKANLVSIAAAYDKMDASSASKILSNMCGSSGPQKESGNIKWIGSNFDDAVKILHYMTERTKAKLLAEMVNSEPKLTAALCERLKQIAEVK
jgi:flagellar motility protein MotE (MotC chaperone)